MSTALDPPTTGAGPGVTSTPPGLLRTTRES